MSGEKKEGKARKSSGRQKKETAEAVSAHRLEAYTVIALPVATVIIDGISGTTKTESKCNKQNNTNNFLHESTS